MPNRQKVFGVLLTDEAWKELAVVLEPYTSQGPIGNYIYCRDVSLHGTYFAMVAECENPDGSLFEAEILVPHHYVKCCISAPETAQFGFVKN